MKPKLKMKTGPKIIIALALIGGIAFVANSLIETKPAETQTQEQVAVETANEGQSALEKASAAVTNAVKKQPESVEDAPTQQLDASSDRGLQFLLNGNK